MIKSAQIKLYGIILNFSPGIPAIAIIFLFVNSCLAGQASKEAERDSLEIERLTEKVRTYFRTGDLEFARITVDSIYELAVSTKNTVKIGDSYFNHGLIDRALGNTESFREHMRQAVSYYRKAKDWDKAARSYTAIAQSFLKKKIMLPRKRIILNR